MTKLPHPRLYQLLEELLINSLPQEELARRLQVSTRTVRTDVTTLNEIIIGHGARLVHQRGMGYELKIYNQIDFDAFLAGCKNQVVLPRTSQERVLHLQLQLLTSHNDVKLESLAEHWYLSRAALQGDMSEVREKLAFYNISVQSRPKLGMSITGEESSIRACLTRLLYQELLNNHHLPKDLPHFCSNDSLTLLSNIIYKQISQYNLRISDDNLQQLVIYSAVTAMRISDGHELTSFMTEDLTATPVQAAQSICLDLQEIEALGIDDMSMNEVASLAIQIQARVIAVTPHTTAAISQESENLVNHLLDYIASHYPYDLRHDLQLKRDMFTHISTMLLRAKYQIGCHNPLADHIKQHYPLSYDITLAALSAWFQHSTYPLTTHEIGYLVIHIGVGIERHYDIGYRRRARALLVCDSGTATFRVLEARIRTTYPQLELTVLNSIREYEAMDSIKHDFVISTVKVTEKNIPLVLLDPFPTQYQLEQLGKQVLIDRTRPYMLKKYFNAEHFLIIDPDTAPELTNQEAVFNHVCQQLEGELLVAPTFRNSVFEREKILSTMMGDNLALPHSLELLAHKTCVYTVLAPKGIDWGGNETAQLIFVLAISKSDYEESMALYDLFITFINGKATKNLVRSTSFKEFMSMANQSIN